MFERLYESKLAPWSEHEESIFDPKPARMRRAFETLAIMVAAVRSALTNLKAGQAPVSENGLATDKPQKTAFATQTGPIRPF